MHPRDTSVSIVVKKYLHSFLKNNAPFLSNPSVLDERINESVPRVISLCRDQDALLDEHSVVERYPTFTLYALRSMRYRNQGPPYIKTGTYKNSRVLYRVADIERWYLEHYYPNAQH